METQNLITVAEFCTYYKIPESFILSLEAQELVEIRTKNEAPCIQVTEIQTIEKLIRFHFEMDINIEGIHAISNLLDKMERLQREVRELHNRLAFYEQTE